MRHISEILPQAVENIKTRKQTQDKFFIGYYERNGEENFDIYYKNFYGFEEWSKTTFSPDTKNIMILDFKITGKNYQERKNSLEDLAKDWQNNFACLSWSYGELALILGYFEENAKRYGLTKEFKENGII